MVQVFSHQKILLLPKPGLSWKTRRRFPCPGHNFPMICWELAPNLRRTNNNNHSKTVCSFTTNQQSNQPTTTNIIPCQGSEIQLTLYNLFPGPPKQNKLKHKISTHFTIPKNIHNLFCSSLALVCHWLWDELAPSNLTVNCYDI